VTERLLRVAFDLGAGSGRALLGSLRGGRLTMPIVHRFHYEPRPSHGLLRWDMERLFAGLRTGLKKAHEAAQEQGGRLASVGVCSWAVDYGLVDERGQLLDDPVCYRDPRTLGEPARVFARIPRAELFARTGVQSLPFNTLYQLLAETRAGVPAEAAGMLMIPDLCHHFLSGSRVTERTNATTTQLVNAHTGAWDEELVTQLGLPRRLLPEIVPAGAVLGRLRSELRFELGLTGLDVIAPCTHDTASAVVGTPLGPGWAYISSGTWSLVGVERAAPLLRADLDEAGFSNEGGFNGTVRLLKNVMGLWLLESCRKEWAAHGTGGYVDISSLLSAATEVTGFPGFVFPDDPRFFNPGSMVRELRAALRETGQRDVDDPARLARVILDSLAFRYASVVETLERLGGRTIDGLHVVGGGAQNSYLNQATADATRRTVLAGPVEATAAGNLLVQIMAGGEIATLAQGRELLAKSFPARRFEPRDEAAWERAGARYAEIEAKARERSVTAHSESPAS
jgi:rhamnulokinase